MKNFSISRINTRKGIFRISGKISSPEALPEILDYDKVEFMGTDGWCEMNLQSSHTRNLLSEIKIEIIEHVR